MASRQETREARAKQKEVGLGKGWRGGVIWGVSQDLQAGSLVLERRTHQADD